MIYLFSEFAAGVIFFNGSFYLFKELFVIRLLLSFIGGWLITDSLIRIFKK